MKKILMLLLVLFSFLIIPKVEAQDYKLTKIDQDGIYFVRTGGTVPDKNGTFAIYYLGGSLAYCVDPGKRIKTEDYIAGDGFIDLPYSDEVKEKMELYGYYGREYPGHDNVRYSMAAQSLIWKAAGVQNVTFWTGKNGTGEIIDISKEVNEILDLVDKHRLLPNISENVSVDVLHETVIEDSNHVLDNFEVFNGSTTNAYISNNKLHLMSNKKGVDVIRLQRKKYDGLNTIIFVGKNDSDTQPLGRLRFSDLSEREIYVYTDGVHIFLHKLDENGNELKIPSIEFKIKNLQTGEYLCDRYDCVFETDPTGLLVTNDVDFGDYQIEEVESHITPGYSWNSEKKVFTITEDIVKWSSEKLSYIDVYFTNHSVSASLEIYKNGEKALFKNNEITYEEMKLGNVVFDLYDNSNKLIKTITMDNNGYAKVDNLKIGKYYVIERNVDGYIPNTNKVNFEIKQIDSHQKHINYRLDVKNTLKKGKVEFSKIDKDTNVGINNTIIEIYNDKNELLLTKTTDNNGKVIIDNLPAGKYYIKEKEANYYYEKTDEISEFEIKENGETVKTKMTNKKIVGNLELYKKGENYHFIDNKIIYEKMKLHNIEFDLYKDDGNLIDHIVTDNNGYAKYLSLSLGKYYLIEKTNLDNYVHDNNKYSFEIKKNGNKGVDAKLEIDNILKKGSVEFLKIDNNTNEGISNTIIEIYNEKGLLFTKETDNNGKIVINNLPLGKYYIKEKEANFNYEKTDEIINFEIKENGEVVKTKMTNNRILGNIEIYKKGEDYKYNDNDIIYEKDALANIEFELYDSSDKLIATMVTNSDGYIKYEKLPLGKYYVIEKTRLNNYITNDNKYSIEIKKNGNKAIDVKLEIDNYLRKGTLEFNKLDMNTNEGISNTIIEIYSADDRLLLTRETDELGKIVINKLPIGKYYIMEKEANSKYQITNEKVEFEIKENDEIVKAQMLNEKIIVPVPKTDTKEELIANSISLIGFLIGVGGLYNERKKTY